LVLGGGELLLASTLRLRWWGRSREWRIEMEVSLTLEAAPLWVSPTHVDSLLALNLGYLLLKRWRIWLDIKVNCNKIKFSNTVYDTSLLRKR
jgi:hypothetical protein